MNITVTEDWITPPCLLNLCLRSLELERQLDYLRQWLRQSSHRDTGGTGVYGRSETGSTILIFV